MRTILKIALGIIAAIGGFLDIGDLVFTTQAGALFRYDLLWAVVLGVIGIGVYAEMSGRVAAVSGRPVFDVIRMRMGFGIGLLALVASTAVNLLTVAAELGGIAIVLELLLDAPYSMFVVTAAAALVLIVALLPFGGIERVFGYGGLLLFVVVATVFHQDPKWGDVARGFVPSLHSSTLYLYFVVGVFAAALMPYEVHFYSSGAIEEGWTEENLKENRLNAIFGYGVGGVLAVALVIVSGTLFHPLGVEPSDLGTVALPMQGAFGETGLLLALGGILFCVGGAAIDSSFAASYNLAQFLGWEWGRYQGPRSGAAGRGGPLPAAAAPLGRADRAARLRPGDVGQQRPAHPLGGGRRSRRDREAAEESRGPRTGDGGRPAALVRQEAAVELKSLSELLGRRVVDRSGRRLGRVYEAKAHWERDGTVVIDELILDRGGLRRRLRGPGGPEEQSFPWEAVVELTADAVVVRT
ncbi:MAG TPA: divalent metal cation transporter [Solirubrobacterales bacterium]|nr:divalent metal cation transporter [Solirubrobacterales bacterium]